MTKKERLLQDIQYAIDHRIDRFFVKVETKGSDGLECIINPLCNLEQKKTYYDNAYDDNLVLKSYNGIRLTSWGEFSVHEDKYVKDVVLGDELGEDIYV